MIFLSGFFISKWCQKYIVFNALVRASRRIRRETRLPHLLPRRPRPFRRRMIPTLSRYCRLPSPHAPRSWASRAPPAPLCSSSRPLHTHLRRSFPHRRARRCPYHGRWAHVSWRLRSSLAEPRAPHEHARCWWCLHATARRRFPP